MFLHGGQHLLTHVIQQCWIAPRGLGDQVVQRLACGLNVVRVQSRRHRLDTFSFAGQQQTLAIVLQRRVPVFVPRGARQALYICREAFLLWAWRREA